MFDVLVIELVIKRVTKWVVTEWVDFNDGEASWTGIPRMETREAQTKETRERVSQWVSEWEKPGNKWVSEWKNPGKQVSEWVSERNQGNQGNKWVSEWVSEWEKPGNKWVSERNQGNHPIVYKTPFTPWDWFPALVMLQSLHLFYFSFSLLPTSLHSTPLHSTRSLSLFKYISFHKQVCSYLLSSTLMWCAHALLKSGGGGTTVVTRAAEYFDTFLARYKSHYEVGEGI